MTAQGAAMGRGLVFAPILAPILALLLAAAPCLAPAAEEGPETVEIVFGFGVETREVLVETFAPPPPVAKPAPGAEPPSPPPLLIVLHDKDQAPARIRAVAGFQDAETLLQAGWTVAYPRAKGGVWNAGRRGHDGREAVRHDDVAYLRAMIAQFALSGRADPRRVFVAGLGEGGAMALRLLCDAPGLVSGAAVVMATWPPSLTCPLSAPVPILMFHGGEDPSTPETGGQQRPAFRVGMGALGTPRRTEQAAARINQCAEPRDATRPGQVRLRIWSGCRQPFVHWLSRTGGHRWPGSPEQGGPRDGLGPPAPQPEATREIVTLFSSLAARPGP